MENISTEEVTKVFGNNASLSMFAKIQKNADLFRQIVAVPLKKFALAEHALKCKLPLYYVDDLGFYLAITDEEFKEHATLLNKLTLHRISLSSIHRPVVIYCVPALADRFEFILQGMNGEIGYNFTRDGNIFTSEQKYCGNSGDAFYAIVGRVSKIDQLVACGIFNQTVFICGGFNCVIDLRPVNKTVTSDPSVFRVIGCPPSLEAFFVEISTKPIDWFYDNKKEINESSLQYYFRWKNAVTVDTATDAIALWLITTDGKNLDLMGKFASCKMIVGKKVNSRKFINLINAMSPQKYDVEDFLAKCDIVDAASWIREHKLRPDETAELFRDRCDVARELKNLVVWLRFNAPKMGITMSEYRKSWPAGPKGMHLDNFNQLVRSCGYCFEGNTLIMIGFIA